MTYKPLLGPCDSYQLEPFAYEWAWKMARDQEALTWSPEETPTDKDVFDYKDPTLDPRHKHLFESVLAQLTTFDIERGDDAAETFLTLFQPAEIRHFFKRLIWEEGLHTRSYRFVIENLGVPLEIYDRWQTIPAMKARIDMASELSRPVELIIAQVKLNGTGYGDLGVTDRQDILRSLIFWGLIFEGVFFWLNLIGPVQQLSRLGRFRRAAEQFAFILRDEVGHVRFGQALIREYMQQHKDCLTPGFLTQIHEDAVRAIQLENDFMAYCLKDGPIVGYSLPEHIDTAKFFANMQYTSVGLQPPFDDARHAFPWFSEVMELNKEKSFFEVVVQEYRKGAGLFSGDEEMEDALGNELWNNPVQPKHHTTKYQADGASFTDDEDDWQLNM